MKSPLRFLFFTELFPSESSIYISPESFISPESLIQLGIRLQLEAQNDNFVRNSNFWLQWLKNIEECVAIIRRELNLSIPPERWLSDYYQDAEGFLQKVAELEKDKSTPFEKIELLTALREYWFSMQIGFDYDFYDDYFSSSGTGGSPFFDPTAANEVTLGDVVSSFYPNC